ncbi:MAG: type I-B CRISPR-associated protein Cas8b1/Cst1 [Candidatus Cloacimonetes bacterium]|nr:type I-B CRISPR-associated protein Cas8b1/Cst1 [Candidatus Cloacimonadota bacterium]
MENIFQRTGDPFIDAGGMALEYISEQFPEKSIDELIEWAAKIYVEKWRAKIDAIFLNSSITHNSKQGAEKVTATISKFKEIKNSSNNEGYCRFCGKEAFLTDAGRDQTCLAGSKAFVNFHHSHESGIMICPECAEKYFFLPFAVLQMGNLCLLQTITEEGNEYWKHKTVQENLNRISRGSSETILKSKFTRASNAIFHFASELITACDYKLESEHITMYHFTNFSSSVDCKISTIPNPVFRFINLVLKTSAREWYNFIYRNYHIGGAKWNDETDRWEKKGEPVEEDEYRNHTNSIFNSLLEGKSILPSLVRYSKKQLIKEKTIDSRIAIYYVQEVKGMTSEQISLIKSVGGRIFEIMQQENNFKKYMVKLEGATKAYQLRTAILNIIKKNYTTGNERTIVTFDEWVNYLFPDGQYWGEIRDLLLVFLYEKLHSGRIKIDIDDVEQINEPLEENEGI